MTELISGNIVLNEYQISRVCSEDIAYVRVECVLLSDVAQSVELQILRTEIEWGKMVGVLLDYFDALASAPKKFLHVPQQIASDSHFPLVLIYDAAKQTPLVETLRASPKTNYVRWHEASEALHALHNKSLVHGSVIPDHWRFDGIKTLLTGFGYAPILEDGPPEIRSALQKSFAPYLAPESMQREIGRAGDIYGYARCVASQQPIIKSSAWFGNATSPQPQLRPRSMRLAWSGLQTALQAAESATDPPPQEEPPKNQAGGIKPSHTVSVQIEPENGGLVAMQTLNEKSEAISPKKYLTSESGARYAHATTLQVWAKPQSGWQFDGWGGDLTARAQEATLKVENARSIIAHFSKVPLVQWNLMVRVEPSQGGVVYGNGQYVSGDIATLQAQPLPGFRFAGWSGDACSDAATLTLLVERALNVVARFEQAPTHDVTVNCEPAEGGTVRGAGLYTQGHTAALRAQSTPLWRFSHWSGAVQGRANPLDLQVDTSLSLTAHFVRSMWEDAVSQTTPNSEPVQSVIADNKTGNLGNAFSSQPQPSQSPSQNDQKTKKSVIGNAFSKSEQAPPDTASSQENSGAPQIASPSIKEPTIAENAKDLKPKKPGLGKAFG